MLDEKDLALLRALILNAMQESLDDDLIADDLKVVHFKE